MAINSLSAASKGFAGLASGLDTESMVEQMLQGTQTKIDTTNQKITQLEYKQELYRDVISDLHTFQSTYFSYTNQATNILSNAFFQSMSASSVSKAYSVTATTSATAGNVTINSIESLASKYKQTAKVTASASLSGSLNSGLAGAWKQLMTDEEKLTIKIGDKEAIEISAASLAGKSSLEMESVINAALADSGASVQFLNGTFTINTEDKAKFTIGGTEKALEMIGGKEVTLESGTALKIDSAAVLPSIKLDVDGVSKTITFNPFKSESIAEQLNSAIADSFGSGITVSENDGVITFSAENASRKLTISGDEESLAIIGIKNNASNKITLGKAVSENSFATPVLGQYQKFSINGVDFSFSSDTSIANIISEINNSEAGVTVSYSSTTDKFSIEADATGSRSEGFSITQSEGNLMTAMFGVANSGNVSGKALSKTLTKATLPADFSFDGGSVELMVNNKKVSLNIEGEYATADELVTKINDALKSQFGETEGVANVKFEIDGDNISLKTESDYTASVAGGLEALGFDTKVTKTTTLAELGISEDVSFTIGDETPVNLTFDKSTTIEDMVNQINDAYKSISGEDASIIEFDENCAPPYIRLCGVEIPMRFVDISGNIFGQTEGTIGSAGGDISTGDMAATQALFDVTDGSNAVLYVDGVKVERASNAFTLDGLSFNLSSTTDEASTVKVTQDTDKIYDTIVKFVEDYNKLVNTINGLLDAEATYREYDPLTTAQEEEMTETQIEKWNEKAKEGLLRNDSTLTRVLADLRSCLYTKPEGGFALYDLGITTSYFGTKDNLTIEDSSELKSLIAENPEKVMTMFADTSKGLATLLNKAIDNAAKVSTTNPGSLVRMAGSTGRNDTTSNIYKQTKELKDQLKHLEDQYENEYDRYWGQFNQMEQLISEANSTSSWLSSMLGQ